MIRYIVKTPAGTKFETNDKARAEVEAQRRGSKIITIDPNAKR